MIAAIVLAAGLSRRMGAQKLLLGLRGKPVVRWAVEALIPHVDDVVVVSGPDDGPLRAALAGLRVRFTVNPHPEAGQGTSIAKGASALGAATRAAFVVLGDQPDLATDVMPLLLAAWRQSGKPIVAPVYRGEQGNPVLFGAEVFPELVVLSGDAGARAVVQRDPARVERLALDLPMPVDVDTPEDYARLGGRAACRRVQ